ncbi:GPR1/FUN34/YaaH family transporter [Streptomyces sp. NPDC057686]|uniref:GPR1/FUN34/YaaH family transporter n=1 Tax=unclassified Streptomyces TaxID=2593676 RepID=UPI0036748226
MDNGVSAGSTASTSTLGNIALGLTLLAFGIGHTGIVSGVSAANSVSLATYVGGLALFVLGILEFRGGNGFNGTAYAGLGAFWFTWASGADGKVSAHAAGLFLVLFALLALTLTVSASSGLFGQGTYALLTLSLLLLAVGSFADSGGLAKAAGWVAAVSGLLFWYGATAALAHWPTALGKASGSGAVAAG